MTASYAEADSRETKRSKAVLETVLKRPLVCRTCDSPSSCAFRVSLCSSLTSLRVDDSWASASAAVACISASRRSRASLRAWTASIWVGGTAKGIWKHRVGGQKLMLCVNIRLGRVVYKNLCTNPSGPHHPPGSERESAFGVRGDARLRRLRGVRGPGLFPSKWSRYGGEVRLRFMDDCCWQRSNRLRMTHNKVTLTSCALVPAVGHDLVDRVLCRFQPYTLKPQTLHKVFTLRDDAGLRRSHRA